ncbi:MAG: M23 family metallopeptidase [Deltaproteobacteria bacterium]|nr:M23 family metallopeptidase [Deltaproteobacteria bacterium]MDQ3366039.1 M23 family metallopeptidase [Myxococcota bacterium]
MDDIALALNPPRFVQRRQRPIRLARSSSRVWPLAAINGRAPVVLDPTRPRQRGVELAYPRVTPVDAIASCPVGSPNGTATQILPAMTAAFAIDDGVISFVGRLGNGFGLIIDHGNGSASHYANLQVVAAIRTDLYRPREQRVRAGDVIGYVGAPAPEAFKQLYFELWESDLSRCFVPVDPRPHLVGWKLLEHHDAFTPAQPISRTEAA